MTSLIFLSSRATFSRRPFSYIFIIIILHDSGTTTIQWSGAPRRVRTLRRRRHTHTPAEPNPLAR